MKPLHVRPEAELDIFEAAVWYETEQRDMGFEFEAELSATYVRIVENPRQFPIQKRDARRALVSRFPYGVYFIERDDDIVVIGVFHLHRDPETWERR